jgi:PAS domain S-box-containing protein
VRADVRAPGTRTADLPEAFRSLDRQRRRFLVVLPVTAVVLGVFALLLQPALLALSVRQAASGLGLILSGGFLGLSCWHRSRLTDGRRRRSWRLITAGAAIAVVGNVWATAVGSDPVTSPSTFSDLTITVALLLCIGAVLGFPSVRRRGVDLVVIALDGLVVGGAVLIIASTLVYSRLLDQTRGGFATEFSTLLIPVLDVVLVVVALLLLLRSHGSDRRALAFLALGFLAYATADLQFAVDVAKGDFAFGTPLDLGWIAGYCLLALAAWYPSVEADVPEGSGTATDARDTVLVYLVLLLAGAVQVSTEPGRNVAATTAALWLVLAVAAAGRQIVLTRDNTLLRRGLEQRVREQTGHLRRMARETEVLLTSVGDGIYGVDAEGLITFVNPSGARALGFAAEELLGRNAHHAFHAPPADGGPHPYDGCYIAEAIASGAVTAAEEDCYVRADGSEFPVEITASPLVDDDVVRGAVVVFRDVTQRREVDRMKNEFISVVSHELRTPLTSIRGSLDLLASGVLGELTPRAESMANIALESSERLTRLINDILDLERIESGTRPMDLTAIDAADLLTRSVTEMESHARSTGVRIEVAESAGRVLADPDRIVQTLTNLLGNAIKFSSAGQVVVADAVPRDGQVLFRVRDQGRGIPEDKLETIFQRFEQVDSSDARQSGGTGLGLAISRGIVERHGGRIWAESRPGAGATVQFTLPAAGRPKPAGVEPAGRDGRPTPTPTADRPGAVLLVEDDDDLADVLSTLLAEQSVATARATGVDEAIRLAAELRPVVVVLDLVLPDGHGTDVVAALRRDPRTADLDLVVYSAADVEQVDRDRLTLGRTAFLTKSRVDPAALARRVGQLLDHSTEPGRTTT